MMGPGRPKDRNLRWAATVAVLGLALAGGPAPAGAQQPSAHEGSTARPSRALLLVSSEEVEQAAQLEYGDLKRQAAAQGALAPPGYPPLQRVRRISEQVIAQAARFNPRASQWGWEVNLIGSQQVNAFVMPGGKIAVFTGLLDRLKPTDDELAAVIGHEVAHALLEHGRERMSKTRATRWVARGASVLSHMLGYGDSGGQIAGTGAQLALRKHGHDDETEADEMGLELTARAGYDPRAALTLWQKMDALNPGRETPPQWLSTHPSNATRVREVQARLPQVLPLYAEARGVQSDSLSQHGEPSAAVRPAVASPRETAPERQEDSGPEPDAKGPRSTH